MSSLELRDTLLAWANEAPSRLAVEAVAEEAKKPWIQLPGPNWILDQCATDLGKEMAPQPIYKRGGLPMWSNDSGSGLQVVDARAFASWVEQFVTMWTFTGNPKCKAPLSLTNEDAGRLLAAQAFKRQLRPVDRINPVRLPVLRSSGALELLPVGYDAESKTLTLEGIDYPVDMTFHDAWDIMADLLKEFPFAKEPIDDEGITLNADRNLAVAISAMVGVFARGLLPQDSQAPAFLYVANTEGAGKTLLASLALVPVYGQMAIQPPPKDEEKLKQELLTLVMSGQKYVVFDNWRGQVASSALEGFITATHTSGRVLGGNLYFEGRKEVDVFITGNNCTTNGDIRRRSLMCDLFVEEARSEDRQIVKRMDIPAIQARRGEILAALWALVKNWDAEGRVMCTKTHGSFPAWASTIGGIVEAARFGCCIGESRSTRSGDLHLQQMMQLCEAVFKGQDDAPPPTGQNDAGGLRNPLRKGLTFEGVVGVAQEAGLFEELLDTDDEGKLDRKCKSAFSKLLKRYDCRTFKGSIKMSAQGAGHARKYVFERLSLS